MPEDTETTKSADVAGRLDGLVRRLRKHALPDPHDERPVLHAPLLTEAADELELMNKYLIAVRDHLEASEAPFYDAMLIIKQALLPPNAPLTGATTNDKQSRDA